MNQLQKYTWLIDTIRRAGKISHKDLSDRLGALQGFERLQAASSRHVQPLARCNLRAVRDND